MKLIRLIAMLLALSAAALATTVTGTVTDTDGQTWNGGAYTITYTNTIPGAPSVNGASITTSFSGNLDSSGALAVTLPANATIFPAGSKWSFNVCPAINNPTCYSTAITIVGSSQSISSQLSAIAIAPRVTGGPLTLAYRDSEVNTTPPGFYLNITDHLIHYYNQTSWESLTTGGGGGGCAPDGSLGAGSVLADDGAGGCVDTPLSYVSTDPSFNVQLVGISTDFNIETYGNTVNTPDAELDIRGTQDGTGTDANPSATLQIGSATTDSTANFTLLMNNDEPTANLDLSDTTGQITTHIDTDAAGDINLEIDDDNGAAFVQLTNEEINISASDTGSDVASIHLDGDSGLLTLVGSGGVTITGLAPSSSLCTDASSNIITTSCGGGGGGNLSGTLTLDHIPYATAANTLADSPITYDGTNTIASTVANSTTFTADDTIEHGAMEVDAGAGASEFVGIATLPGGLTSSIDATTNTGSGDADLAITATDGAGNTASSDYNSLGEILTQLQMASGDFSKIDITDAIVDIQAGNGTGNADIAANGAGDISINVTDGTHSGAYEFASTSFSIGGGQVTIDPSNGHIIDFPLTASRPVVTDSSKTLISSTYNIPKMMSCGTTSTCAQTVQTQGLFTVGTAAFNGSATATISLSNLPFTSATTYQCAAVTSFASSSIMIGGVNADGGDSVITSPTASDTSTVTINCWGY